MLEKITLLFIHHGKGIGGASMSLFYLVKNLSAKQYNPIVLFLEPSEAFNMFKDSGITCLGPLSLSDFSHTVIWWYKWYHIKALFRAIISNLKVFFYIGKEVLQKVNPDIVHLNTSSLFVWAMVAHRLKIPVVCHIREPLSNGYFGLRKRIVKYAVGKYSNAIVPISNNEAIPWKNSPKTKVVYNVVPETFKPQLVDSKQNKDPDNNKRILFLGGMSEQKGTLLILQAFQLLKNSGLNVQLVIAGNFFYEQNWLKKLLKITSFARYSAAVEQKVQELGKDIEFKGLCTNVPELISNCNILVFPATTGHFARPIIEAGFCSKPVVATNLAPLDELVIDGKTGFLVPLVAELFAQKLAYILNNPSIERQLGEGNYNFCKKNFCLNIQLNKMTRIYKSLM